MDFEIFEKFLKENQLHQLKLALEDSNPVDAAEFLSELEGEDLPKVFRLLKKDFAADVFAELDSDITNELISSMSDKEIAKIIDELSVDDAVDTLEELPATVVNRILKNTPAEARAEINRFLNYPDESAGSIMTSEFASVRSNMTVQEAIEHIRRTGVDKETVYVIYVTDKTRILEGTLGLRDLLFADPEATVASIMSTSTIFATTTDTKEHAANLISRYGFLALPIVDSERRLVGIVTVDDALDLIRETATNDIEKMAAITPTDKSYLKTGVFEIWSKRSPWLLLLVISATFTGMIINRFEDALSKMVALTAFIPMLMNSGGSAGSQASVTVIQGLSLGELKPENVAWILWKEFRVAILSGICLGGVIFLKVLLIDRLGAMVALIIALTLFCCVIMAKLVGAVLPLLAKIIGFDPAVMASPFITTIVDAVTLIIYFTLATAILKL